MIPRISLTGRLTALFALVSISVLAALGGFIITTIDRHFRDEDRMSLQHRLRPVLNVLNELHGEALSDTIVDSNAWRGRLTPDPSLALLIVDKNGKALYANPDIDFPEVLKQADSTLLTWTDGEGAYRGLVRRLDVGTDRFQPAVAVGAIRIDHHIRFMAEFERTLAAFIGVAALVCGTLGWQVARHGLRPLRAISARAASVTANKLDLRMPVDAVPPEMADLAATLNAMLLRLQTAFQRLSDFSSDLAHELRTPITNLMTQTHVVLAQARDADSYREVLVSNAEELERLARIIADMLFLAKAEHGLLLPSTEPVRLHDEVQGVMEFYDALAEEREIVLQMSGEGAILGDRLMLRRALSNLLSNAIRHAPPRSMVRIAIVSCADHVSVSVDNAGPAIRPDQQQRLFDRFYRGDSARARHNAEGAGLGLAITRSIVNAHGGEITATSTEDITRFECRFPNANAPLRIGPR